MEITFHVTRSHPQGAREEELKFSKQGRAGEEVSSPRHKMEVGRPAVNDGLEGAISLVHAEN